jgi:hypothetical protein
MVSLLVAEKRRSHTTNDDVDGNTKRDEEARGDGTHAGQNCYRCRTTKDKHGGNNDISR